MAEGAAATYTLDSDDERDCEEVTELVVRDDAIGDSWTQFDNIRYVNLDRHAEDIQRKIWAHSRFQQSIAHTMFLSVVHSMISPRPRYPINNSNVVTHADLPGSGSDLRARIAYHYATSIPVSIHDHKPLDVAPTQYDAYTEMKTKQEKRTLAAQRLERAQVQRKQQRQLNQPVTLRPGRRIGGKKNHR